MQGWQGKNRCDDLLLPHVLWGVHLRHRRAKVLRAHAHQEQKGMDRSITQTLPGSLQLITLMQGVTIPSQIRYVQYFERALQNKWKMDEFPQIAKKIVKIKLLTIPHFNFGGGCSKTNTSDHRKDRALSLFPLLNLSLTSRLPLPSLPLGSSFFHDILPSLVGQGSSCGVLIAGECLLPFIFACSLASSVCSFALS